MMKLHHNLSIWRSSRCNLENSIWDTNTFTVDGVKRLQRKLGSYLISRQYTFNLERLRCNSFISTDAIMRNLLNLKSSARVSAGQTVRAPPTHELNLNNLLERFPGRRFASVSQHHSSALPFSLDCVRRVGWVIGFNVSTMLCSRSRESQRVFCLFTNKESPRWTANVDAL